MADLEKKIVIPVEPNLKKADAQIDKFKKDVSQDGVSIPVNINISEITKSLDTLKGMIGKIGKAFDEDVKFSGIQKGLDDVLSRFNSIIATFNKGKPTEFQAMKVSVVGLKELSDATKEIKDNIKSLNDTKIDINSFEKLYSIFEKMEGLLHSIVKGMNFDNIRPSTQIQEEINETTEGLEKLAKSEEKIKKLEKYFNNKTAKGLGKDILEWGDSEGIKKESTLTNLITKMKEYIKLGGDLSKIKFDVFDMDIGKKVPHSFADVLEILQEEGKFDVIDSSKISQDVAEVEALRLKLEELSKELNDAKIRENRDLNVSLDTKSVDEFAAAITEAVKSIENLNFEIPDGFTLEGLSPENLDKIVNKLEEIVLSIKNIGNALSNGVDFSEVDSEKLEPITFGIKPKVDPVEFCNDVEKQLKDSFVEIDIEPVVEPIKIQDNIVKIIDENIPKTKEIEIKFKHYKDTDILTDASGKVIEAYRGVQEAIGGMISDKQGGITFYSDRYDVAESYANRLYNGKELQGKVYKTNLAMKNPLEIDAKGSTWKSIKYLGDESDESSEKIIELDQKIKELRSELGKLYNFDGLENGFFLDEFGTIQGIIEDGEQKLPQIFNSINEYEKGMGKFSPMSMIDKDRIEAEKLLKELQKVCAEYYEISDAKDNMYGTHTTDEWANIAKENGYDGIIIKNLYDAVGDSFKGEDSLSTIFAVFDSEQLKNIQVAKNAVEEFSNAEKSIDGSKVNDFGESFKNIGKIDVSEEVKELGLLEDKLADVTDAVDMKTRAFQEEEQVVVGTVQREISNLELLDGQLLEVISTIEKLKTTPINLDLKLSSDENGDDNLTKLLSDLDEKIKNLDIESLTKFSSALKDLKVTGKSAENLEMVAIALGEFRTSLAGISTEENNFLVSISTIVSKTDELKDLAKILESSTKKIKEAGEAVDNIGSSQEGKEGSKKGKSSKKDSSDKKTDAINKTINKMKELKYVGSGEQFEEMFAKASKKIEEFNADLASGDKTLEEYNVVVERLFNNIKSGYTNQKGKTFDFIEPDDLKAAEKAMRDYALSVSGGNAELKKTIDGSGNVVYTWTDENKIVHTLTQSYDQMTGALGRVHKQQKQTEKHNKTFIESLKQGWLNVRQYVMSFVGFYEIVNAIKTGLNVIRDLDTALTEMRKVSDETVSSLKNFQDVSFDIASSIGTTAKEIQNSSADFMRLGYSLKEASELAEDANIYANVGDMEIDEATEHMVSSIKAWGSEFSSEVEASGVIVDRYNEIGNNFAITSADIGSAMERSAAALKAGGNTLNEALGLITAGNLIQQDADTTANALKVMSLRIRGSKTELAEMGEETDGLASSTSKLREEVKALTGVDIMSDDNTYKSTAQIIQEIGAVYDKLSDVSQASLLEKLAGKTRASTVAGLLENYETIGEVIESAENADGSAIEENLRYMESIEGKISKFTNEVQEFWHNLIDSSTVKGFVDAGTWIIDKLAKIADLLGEVGTLAVGLTTAFSIHKIKNGGGGRVKKFTLVAKYATESFSREVCEFWCISE